MSIMFQRNRSVSLRPQIKSLRKRCSNEGPSCFNGLRTRGPRDVLSLRKGLSLADKASASGAPHEGPVQDERPCSGVRRTFAEVIK